MSPFVLILECHRSLSVRIVTVRLLYVLATVEVFRMQIRTATELGAFIRERRIALGMDQIALATKTGTSRKWLIEVERGKPGAEIGLILRTLKALTVSIDLKTESPTKASDGDETSPANINRLLNTLKRRP
jgi:HTH-type transcriptional regulator/antitoxin HipB